MKKILLSVLTIGMVSAVAFGATTAYFSDTETSTGNTFSAGTLDLDVDGNNGSNTVKFTVANMKPGSQQTGKYTLNNVGSINGFLDLENISVTNNENNCIEPETDAGDVTCNNLGPGEGELQNVVNMKLYWDNDCDGYWSTGDVYIYNGLTGGVASNYEENKPLNASASQCVMAVFDWWSTPSDNLAMGDDMTVNITFELAQTTAQ